MANGLTSLIASGTKLWLDSVDPDLVKANKALGATGATSNPVIIADLIKTGRFDAQLQQMLRDGLSDHDVAWALTDALVGDAEQVFLDVYERTAGNDGYVSFELDPLLEDPTGKLSDDERASRYVELAKKWSANHPNRMIKVPATPAGIKALPDMTAAGVPVNVTLIFTRRQYEEARTAAWSGVAGSSGQNTLKSVYSIFVSRIDVYTDKQYGDGANPSLRPEARGAVGIWNARNIWRENRDFWANVDVSRSQDIVFASTGVKSPSESPVKYVRALAGSDIQTNPPATNDAAALETEPFSDQLKVVEPLEVGQAIDDAVDFAKLEADLMAEGIKKFVDPQKALLALIAEKRQGL